MKSLKVHWYLNCLWMIKDFMIWREPESQELKLVTWVCRTAQSVSSKPTKPGTTACVYLQKPGMVACANLPKPGIVACAYPLKPRILPCADLQKPAMVACTNPHKPGALACASSLICGKMRGGWDRWVLKTTNHNPVHVGRSQASEWLSL